MKCIEQKCEPNLAQGSHQVKKNIHKIYAFYLIWRPGVNYEQVNKNALINKVSSETTTEQRHTKIDKPRSI